MNPVLPTSIKVDRMAILSGSTNTKAFADVNLGDIVTIKGFRVVEGKKGLFVSPPQMYNKTDKKYYNRIYFHQLDMLRDINKEVLVHYKKEVSGS